MKSHPSSKASPVQVLHSSYHTIWLSNVVLQQSSTILTAEDLEKNAEKGSLWILGVF